MTVGELIALLQKHDPAMPVAVDDDDYEQGWGHVPVSVVFDCPGGTECSGAMHGPHLVIDGDRS